MVDVLNARIPIIYHMIMYVSLNNQAVSINNINVVYAGIHLSIIIINASSMDVLSTYMMDVSDVNNISTFITVNVQCLTASMKNQHTVQYVQMATIWNKIHTVKKIVLNV